MTTQSNGGRALSRLIKGAAAAFAGLIAIAPASAQQATVTLDRIANVYGVAAGDQTLTTMPGGSTVKAYAIQDLPEMQSEGGVNYQATASDDSFFFLHNNYCVGTCATYSQTIISFTVTNNDSVDLDLRFDSLITPGHIGQIFGDGLNTASFQFDVTQTLSSATINRYSASGGVGRGGIFLETGDLTFNNVQRETTEDYDVLDWSATNLNIELGTLGAGQSTTVTYMATYMSFGTTTCPDVLDCAGAQVVFGDPRNNGGIMARGAFDAMQLLDPQPIVGTEYDPYMVPFTVSLSGDPLPGLPPRITPPPYGQPYFRPAVLGVVPEPATWAMLIGGCGAVGGSLRRRRPAPAARLA